MNEQLGARTSTDSYFKRGARIKPELRARLTEAAATLQPTRPKGEAYALAIGSLHKSWARRWLRTNGYFV